MFLRIAAFKLAAQRNAKKKAEQRKKEAQTREAESQNRKHLAGLRVVQKNLVYVVGLSPGIPEADLLKTLRGDKYFGQYGPIVKIVVSKGKHGETPSSNGSLGVYVTFASAHDAEKCIKAVNNSTNGDRVLRAQLGTTKYCSAYLRNEVCTNKSCMFLHEPGDNDDSYSRQDLSTINSVNTQRPLQYGTSSLSSTVHAARQEAHAQAPIAQAQPVAAATQPMTCTMSTHGSDGGAGPALPTTANWAKSGQQQSSRRHSAATSVASSPAVSTSLPAPAPSEGNGSEDNESDDGQASSVAETTPVPKTPKPPVDPILDQVLSAISRLSTFKASKKESQVTYLPLWDDQGGLKRRRMREAMQQEQEDAAARQQAELERQQEAAAAEATSTPDVVEEQEPASGSGQLGGEPEDVDRDGAHSAGFLDQRCPSTQMPIQRGSQDSAVFGATGAFSPNAVASINGRSLTPMQQQQLLLLKGSQPQSGFADQYPPGMGGLPGPSRLFQQQGHARQLSRYDFSSGAGPSSTPKPGPSSKMLGQQAMGLPSNQFYASAMPGPPPGLKSTGTPPNGMFGQTQFGGAAFGNKENSSDVLRNILSTRAGIGAGGAGVGPGHEAGKREFMFPFSHQYPSASTPGPALGLMPSLYGPQPRAFQEFGAKSKKKGKKHRHANTSSSGGGGPVDLADPNILNTRMPHQQNNAGAGQGLFGGQTQGGYNQNMVYGGAAFRGW